MSFPALLCPIQVLEFRPDHPTTSFSRRAMRALASPSGNHSLAQGNKGRSNNTYNMLGVMFLLIATFSYTS